MLTELAAAAQTFGEGSGPLFDTVTQLAQLTTTLAQNDKFVRAFVQDLAGVSSQLAGERTEIRQSLAAVADAVGTVKGFVHDNRKALVTDVEKLTRVMQTINSEKDSLDTALRVAPTAIGNLSLAYNSQTGTIGSRIGVSGNVVGRRRVPLLGGAAGRACPRKSADLACRALQAAARAGRGSAARRSRPPYPQGAIGATGSPPGRLAERPDGRRLVTRTCCAGACWSVVLAVAASGCKFDGAYDLPLPGLAGLRRQLLRGHRRLRRHPQRRPEVAGDGRRRHRRRGDRRRAGRLARPGHDARQERRRCSPTTRSPTSARSACWGRSTSPSSRRPQGKPTGRLVRRRQDRPRRHRPQPRGRGGARRAVVPAQRRRRRPARHDHPRAQPGDGRSHRPAAAPAGVAGGRRRHDRRPEGRHHQRDGVDRPPDRDPQRREEDDHRRARRGRPGRRRCWPSSTTS